MTKLRLSRCEALASALAGGAFFLLPEAVRAQQFMQQAGIDFGPAEPFSFDQLRKIAQALAAEPFTPMHVADEDILDQIDYDQHNQISFLKDKALWNHTA